LDWSEGGRVENLAEWGQPRGRFIFKTHLKGTYKSQSLRKREGFGNCGELLQREHEIEVER